MKKHLLATSAIVGSLFAFAGQASAQTTVTADMHLTYSAISNEGSAGAADRAGSYRGFGKETQLNIKHVGKLNNGAGYVAGFSIEHDGNDRTSTAAATANTQDLSGMFNENVYMDFILGNTTLTIGADHIQNPDFTYTNLAGFRADPEDILDGVGKNNVGANNLYDGSATSRYSSFGAGIIQDLGIAKVSYYFVPGGTPSAETGVATTPTVAAARDTGETGHEVMARGNLGVKGLDATLFYSTQDSESTAKDVIGRMVGAKYNFGSITVGAELKRNTAATAITTESKSAAIGYAIDKNLTVAVGLMEAENKQPGALTEDTKFLQVGYNLGPVAAGLAYVTADNIGGTLGNEAKGLYFQLSSAF
jgi:hypothetical protein